MVPANYNLKIFQGSTFTRVINVPTTLNLSNYTGIRMKIRPTPQSSEVIWDSATGGLTKVGQVITLLIDSSVTQAFTFFTAGYDIELFNAATPALVDKLLTGNVTLIHEYTR